MNLDELFNYKNRLMGDLLTNPKIVELVEDEIPFESASELAYKRIFPYEYVPETIQDGKTFICFDVDVELSMNKTFLSPILYIWVFSHRSKLRLPNGEGARPDKLCHEICEMINGSRFYGLGELILYSVKRFAPLTDYQGKRLAFKAKDFNYTFVPNKETPSNRKTG